MDLPSEVDAYGVYLLYSGRICHTVYKYNARLFFDNIQTIFDNTQIIFDNISFWLWARNVYWIFSFIVSGSPFLLLRTIKMHSDSNYREVVLFQ